MKNVITFGSSGFIGNNILKHLETKECNAMGFSSKTCNLLHRSDIQKAFSFFLIFFERVTVLSFVRA